MRPAAPAMLLEDHTPYDASGMWRLHDAYFAARGAAAWQEGEIPSLATNAYPTVRQHARLFVALVDELGRTGRIAPTDELRVLEVGAGLGRSAAAFFRALATGCGARGRALLPRVRYLVTDCAEAALRQAAESAELRPLVREGRVRLGLYDLRAPDRLCDLDGRPMDEPICMLLASYVACVTPPKILARTREGWLEKQVRIHGDPDLVGDPWSALLARATEPGLLRRLHLDARWQPVHLDGLLDAPHARALREVAPELEEATIPYPLQFLELLRHAAPRLVEGGLALVNDFGSADDAALAGRRDPEPRHYGNTLNHPVSFAVLAAAARALGWGIERTHGPFRGLHTAAIRFAGPAGAALRRRFRRIYVQEAAGELLTDLRASVRVHLGRGEHAQAARLCERLRRLDPLDPDTRYWLGICCLEERRLDLARRHLGRGLQLASDRPDAGRLDFDLPLGRVYHQQGDPERAVACYQASLARAESALGHAYLAAALWDLGEHRSACQAVHRALARDPELAVARRLLAAFEA